MIPSPRTVEFSIPILEPGFSRKRKWDRSTCERSLNFNEISSMDISKLDWQLETPLPIDWQRCLDVQSGRIYFYNKRTLKRTCIDPRVGDVLPSCPSYGQMSLELELNLPCDSQRKKNVKAKHSVRKSGLGFSDFFKESSNETKDPYFEIESQSEEEMIAIACKRCHLLVMLCKSAPTCPNCKFMHSLNVVTSLDLLAGRKK